MIINNELFMEIASRGVSQKTWDKFNDAQRVDYIKNNPTSKYAKVYKNLPTQIKAISKENYTTDKNEIAKIFMEDWSIRDEEFIPDDEYEFNMYKGRRAKDIDYTVNSDGSVNINDNINLSSVFFDDNGRLKFKINKIDGNLTIETYKIKSFEGFPKTINGSFNLYEAHHIESLKGFPTYICGDFRADDCCSIINDINIKRICRIDGGVYIRD